ncbi:MAG: IS21 family transposase, partial [Chitinophagales bacterium]
MRTIKEALRLHHELGLTMRQVAASLHVAPSTASEVFRRAEAAGLGWPLPDDLDEAELERLLYSGNQGRPRTRPEPDWAYVRQELSKKGVTLELLWMEYKQDHPTGYQYSQFCEHYRRWQKTVDVVLRQNYRAGEKMLVDYAGKTIPIIDRGTGEIHEALLFVSVLGASNYTYAEAHWNQDLASWIGGHCRSFAYFGGVAEYVVPDNPKTAVKRSCWYEPELNRTYQEMAAHYGTAIIPARPRKPRDKAKVEVAVQIAERWIIARLRHQTFHSLDELNRAIQPLLEELNGRPFKKLDGSRQKLFESLEKPALGPLPAEPYEFAQWKKAKVSIDYHIDVDRNFYSVPYQLVGEHVDVRVSFRTVEVYHKGRRVASHVRIPLGKGQYRTDP